MQNFRFENETKIIFGKDTELEVATEVSKYGQKILLHYGGGSIKKTGLYDKVIKSLNDNDISYVELSGVKPNPRLSLVKEGIDICRKEDIDFILAVGGGSVIDSAKAIAAGVKYLGDVWDFFDGKAEVGEAIPIGTILTIPATGSETGDTTILTNEEGWYKRSMSHKNIRPKFAILNPELTYSLPNYQTAAGGVDIMSHVFERYFTNTLDVDITDRLCEGTLKCMIKNLPIALEETNNYAARSEIMWAGTIAHNGLLGTGRVEDWGSHMIAHEISAMYDITHGATLSIIFPAWMNYVYQDNIDRFVQYAIRVWGVEMNFQDPEKTVLEGIERTKEFFKKAGMPTSLSEVDISRDSIEEMAEKCVLSGPVGNFRKLFKDDVVKILEMAF
ncbi:iron-containing alcohol dehydrogenase [Paratissierella segnis]|uniref:Iron-containing alcohol dehydrogenase n=1 Tax=Paratissierella segnis TaxID=2763679 RepID=A0A926ESV8_9FIRM|nr:iron-containing alcohol dehydrogenase [Paratissierella segnis]MBC8589158.1 iron-containing alcohol dehydrogenase [Paratissierella segnis]